MTEKVTVNLATLKKCLQDLDACTTKNRYDVLTEVMDYVLGMEGALRQLNFETLTTWYKTHLPEMMERFHVHSREALFPQDVILFFVEDMVLGDAEASS